MFEKLLNRFGYIKQSSITEDFIITEVAKLIGDPHEYSISEELDADFFRDISNTEHGMEYLKATAAKDMIRHFAAETDKDRWLTRGAFIRTVYLMNRIKKANKPVPSTEIKGLRYS